jgi:hypothetical protein
VSLVLNQIIACIDPDKVESIEHGIELLKELEEIKSGNIKWLPSWRTNTSKLIDEVKSFFETRLEVLETFEVKADFEKKIKEIDKELDEQLTPVKGIFLSWAEKVIKSFIGWLATKKEIRYSDVQSKLIELQKYLTIGWMLHVLIQFITYSFSSPASNVTSDHRKGVSEHRGRQQSIGDTTDQKLGNDEDNTSPGTRDSR